MKVKLFLKYNPLNNEFRNLSDLETEINDWLAASPGIRILRRPHHVGHVVSLRGGAPGRPAGWRRRLIP
jgi:hypothetical protein